MHKSSFGELLQHRRRTLGLTQEELAERAELSVRELAYLERDRHVARPGTVRRLADALGLSDEERASLLAAAGVTMAQVAAEARPVMSLPIQPTRFIGREREVAAVGDLLRQEDVRLLTLTGPGGTGKTRLAVQAAQDLLDAFPDGVVFVPLGALTDPALVPSTIAAALKVKETPHHQPVEALHAYLRERRLLLALDNFEHLLPAASLVSELLAACPQLTVLATSRAVLHLAAEHDYAVQPLAVPDSNNLPPLGRLIQYDSVALFVERARAAKASFSLTGKNAPAVVEICRRLDGLPLAIELAAARIRLFPPQALLGRLANRLDVLTGGARDLPPRQQTLRNTIDWSYSLLSDDEQRLFTRLSVFAGGCTLEAAEAVCNPDKDLDVLKGIANLVDKSLLRQEEEEELRFGMLETLREYAREQLAAQGEGDPLQQRHAAYYAVLAEEAAPELTRPEQTTWLGRLEREHENLRAALAWSLGERSELGLRLAGALWRFWGMHDHVAEGRGWLDAMLTVAREGEGVSALRAKALNGAGLLAQRQGDYVGAGALFEESLRIRQELGYTQGIERTLGNLGLVAEQQGEYQRAADLQEESLRLSRELGDTRGIAATLRNLGLLAERQGEYERARKLYEESLKLIRELGDRWGMAASLSSLGIMAERWGAYEQASELHEEALRLRWELGDKLGIAVALVDLACVAGSSQEHERATRLLGAADTLWMSVDATPEASDRQRRDTVEQEAHMALSVEVYEAAWNRGHVMNLEEAVAYGLDESG